MGSIAAELSTLRALTFRLSSTPTNQLFQQVPAIASSLANCRSLLSSTQASTSKVSSEASVAIHKYRTLLSTLLQDRTVQGRWSAVVLIKATIEAGGWETLQKSLSWVRGLLGVLAKPDPPSTKKLSLITLTRIFILTREYPTLVREITTPSLPAYIQACLQIAASRVPATLLQTIFESFNQLLPRHPTVFRSYLKQLQQLIGAVVSRAPSNMLSKEQLPAANMDLSSEVSEAARQLFVQLPCCTPKGASNEEWAKSLKTTISNAHRIADKVFRAVVEDWQSAHGTTPVVNGQTLEDQVQDLEEDAMGLTPWSGIFAGGERLISLLRLVKEHLANPTPVPVSLPFGLIVDIIARMLSLTIPSTGKSANHQVGPKYNNQVGKDERENLWAILPQIHGATMEILLALADRCEENTTSDPIMLDQLVWVFGCEKGNMRIRTASYLVAAKLLVRSGPALPKSSIDPLAQLIRGCSEDILPLNASSALTKQHLGQNKANHNTQHQALTNADAFLVSPLVSKGQTSIYSGLQQAAYDLLPVLLGCLPAQHISDSVRARMDRSAILTQHKGAMIASVLNPPPSKTLGKPTASILPLLARSFSRTSEVECFIRPRMPVVRVRAQTSEGDDESLGVEDELVENHASLDEDDHFVGEELDSLLETAGRVESVPTAPAAVDAPEAVNLPPITLASASRILPTRAGDAAVTLLEAHGSTKRQKSEDDSLSPLKRVKVDSIEAAIEAETVTSLATLPPTVALPPSSLETPQLNPAAPDFAKSLAPAPEPAAAAVDSDDDDDFGGLVLGQDTDSEPDV